MPFSLRSEAFAPDARIPRLFTDDGADMSPKLKWQDPPPGTVSFALVCMDPDAPQDDPWVHWIIYDIPGGSNELLEGLPPYSTLDLPEGAHQGLNSWSHIGYRGPAPPRGDGVHHYDFSLYALDLWVHRPLLSLPELLDTVRGHILAETHLQGTYSR